MERAVSFTVPGAPVAKARPRATIRGKRPIIYTPDTTKVAEAVVAASARPYFRRPICGPVEIIITSHFAMAKSWSKARRAERLNGPHTQKPDFDNLAKLVCDALNGIAYVDDGQVACATVRKLWALVPRTEITVRPLSGHNGGPPLDLFGEVV